LNTLQTDNAPSLSVVLPPFAIGALAFFSLSILIIFSGADILGPFYNGRLLAITHVAVLGWATMIVFGALYQLIPVVFETALFSEPLAKASTYLFTISTAFLAYSFWSDSFSTILIYASSLMFFSVALFVLNVLLSKRNGKKNIQSRFVTTAVIWLLLTALFGLLISINFAFPFLEKVHLEYLKIHAHIGLIGWFVLLIIGVSSTLIPMFLIAHQLNEKKLSGAFYFINIGLALLAVDWIIWNGSILVYFYWLLISAGIFLYLSFVREAYVKRLRRELDIGMKYTIISIIILLLPMALSFVILVQIDFEYTLLMRITTLYGFSIIFGLITTIILGQTYKTLPFIIWLYKYKQLVGKVKTPMPKELYSEKIGRVQFYAYFLSMAALASALLFNKILLLELGSYFLLLTAVLYNVNVFKIIFHKIKTEGL
jgi:hypothetical protein